MNQATNDVLEQLTLLDIASWQVPEAKQQPKILATLPALQRGIVWKPKQIENLWDSLMRGFPVGSFLVAPYGQGNLGEQPMKYAQGDDGRPYTHYLLDGQQRATAIALGLIAPIGCKTTASLWLDLADAKDKADDREFVFRVINQFHPWGFSRTNPENRLEAKKIREAFEAFKKAAKKSAEDEELQQALPSQFPLKHAWPWEAVAPVPVAFLWEANKRNELLTKLKALPYSESQNPPEWKTKVEAAIRGEGDLGERLDYILSRFAELRDYEVPVLTVSMDAKTPKHNNEASERPDHIETLFVRVNSGGTPLEGEELIYSILKSEWPSAPVFIDQLTHRLTSPARTVVLAARLILARMQQNKADQPVRQPPVPDVSMFRRLLRGADKIHPTFREHLKAFSQETPETGTWVFEAVHDFLTMDKPQESSGQSDNYRLHPYLAADLARGPAGHEVMILVLRWADRLLEAGINPVNLDKTTKQRTLGFITALAWFSVDARECVSRLWPDLQTCDRKELEDFFNAKRFQALIKREEGHGVILIPPVPSAEFSRSLTELCRIIKETALDELKSNYWTSRDFYRNHRNHESDPIKLWMEGVIYRLWHGKHQREDVDAWWIDRIWADRRFVIYAQRNWLNRWFQDYDPTIPGAADTNRPWDYDHIHPNNYIYGRWYLPNFLKQLHLSNGNFRAWPLEANRSDRDSAPEIKLNDPSDHEKRYELKTNEDLRAASFVKGEDLDLWCKSLPREVITNTNYLSDPNNHRDSHLALVHAITKRLGLIYAEWFERLKLEDLVPK